jgi:hypothetical protein
VMLGDLLSIVIYLTVFASFLGLVWAMERV